MRNALLGICLALSAVCHVVQAEDPAPRLKKVIPTDAVQFARSLSPDGQALTLLFDNLQISTESRGHSLPNVVTKQFSFVLNHDSAKDVCVTQDLRGFVSVKGGGSATLLIHSGGKSNLVDLKAATQQAEEKGAKLTRPAYAGAVEAAKQAGFSEVESPTGSADFFHRIETRVAPGKPLQITVILLVEAQSGDDESDALLTIDSIDCEVRAAVAK